MAGHKVSILKRGAFAAAHNDLSTDNSKALESFLMNCDERLSRGTRNLVKHMRVDMPEGVGGISEDFDQSESLSDYVNAEYRVALAEAWV